MPHGVLGAVDEATDNGRRKLRASNLPEVRKSGWVDGAQLGERLVDAGA